MDPKLDDFKMCSPSFRPSVPPTSNPFTLTQAKISRGILKPPQLNVNNVSASSNKPFVLKPSQLNPFGKGSDTSDKTNGENGDKTQNIVNGEAPKFVPLVVSESKKSEISPSTSTTKQTPSTAPTAANSSFVFGQNLQERVVTNETNPDESKASTSDSNGTDENEKATDMLFSSVIKNEVKSDNAGRDKETKTLSESAREYEESRANKRKYEEVEVITGEENENNILNISCKLFSFDKTVSSSGSSYIERGRGTLRLNDFQVDDDHIGSRIVFRTSGSLRVILNTKVKK